MMANLAGVALLFTLALLPFAAASIVASCPKECMCSLDHSGRYYSECVNTGFLQIPINEFDKKMEAIVIRSPQNMLTIGPLFGDFRKLEILRINDANVPAIGRHSFWGVKTLKILDLSQNNISIINDEDFRGQDNLLELNLARNRIERIPSGTFKYLTKLQTLILADNQMEELVPSLFQKLAKLKYLDLSGNPLADLTPDVLKDVTDLKFLKCRRCGLKKINPQLYYHLQQLTELDLGDNQFKYLDKDEFKDLRALRRLHFDRNQLSVVVDGLFNRQKSLELLDISRNLLAKISPKAFDNLSNLTHLDISYNKLSALELDYMSHLPKLQTLKISGNVHINLLDVQPVFESLKELRSLSIADITDIPVGLFDPLTKLEVLNISGTHMGNETSLLLESLKSLVELDLSRNQLRGFDEELAEKLLQIENVRFERNPFVCDLCNMEAILKRQDEMKWKYMPQCFQPEKLRGRPINRLKRNNLEDCFESFADEGLGSPVTSYNFLHQSQINMFAFLVASIFVLLLLIIIVSLSICTRQRAHYYTREDGKEEPASQKILEGSLITGTEINFKFPLDDRAICTIDEICLPPPPPVPPNKIVPRSSS